VRPVSGERLPLNGKRVLSITSVWSGPYASQLLADWGCEVIRVESIQHWQISTRGHRARFPRGTRVEIGAPFPRTYPDRDPGERPWNRSSYFNVHARNQLSMTVDLTKTRGKGILRRLAEVSDVLIENNTPTTLEHMGITYDWLREANPAIIMVRLPAFGLSGPYRNYRAFGDAPVTGFQSLWGYTDVDRPRALSRVAYQDAVAGANAALATAMALHRRNKTGKGALVEIAQCETLMAMLGEAILDYTMNRRVQGSIGNRDIHGAAPSGNYRCKGDDRWVSITVRNDKEWEGFCRALGYPGWTRDERFSTALDRYKNQDDLDKLVETWTIQHDSYAIMHLLQKEGVAAAPITDGADSYADPHFNEIGVLEEVTHPEAGTHLYPGIGWTQTRTPNRVRRHAPRLGEDNEYVYKELLGICDEEYAELEREGHIGMDYASYIP
jgi:crotonobetainyl-CoA:carnitine CoA-transferase CaiB-like acyl-CoA transferase